MVDRKIFRCAVYTRKSTEYGLEQDFNSLDAQRESCEAYIKSQNHEGWKLFPAHYDDGGISGATLERPALQALLAEIKAGKVDIIVVYKVDRLTRSLADFAKLVELFDVQGVSFVSVTQQFNTTTSMGRLTLNVLLSFAQFEREVTAERIRDKVAASKQRGIWTGGSVAVGYANLDKKLIIVESEAEQVRYIFKRYLEVPALSALIKDLDAKGIVTKRKRLSDGRGRGGNSYGPGPLAHLLKNRLYVGEVTHKGKAYAGQHPAIVDREVFDAVQDKLGNQAIARKRQRTASGAVLMGKIFDDAGIRMTPTSTHKGSLRYPFYASAPWRTTDTTLSASRNRVPAAIVEKIVLDALQECRAISVPGEESQPPREISDSSLIDTYVDQIVISKDSVSITFKSGSEVETAPMVLPLPISKSRPRREIIGDQTAAPVNLKLRSKRHQVLVAAIAKARQWAEGLLSGKIASEQELASTLRCSVRYVQQTLALAFLAPDVVEAAIGNDLPSHLNATVLRSDIPKSWDEQRALFGLV